MVGEVTSSHSSPNGDSSKRVVKVADFSDLPVIDSRPQAEALSSPSRFDYKFKLDDIKFLLGDDSFAKVFNNEVQAELKKDPDLADKLLFDFLDDQQYAANERSAERALADIAKKNLSEQSNLAIFFLGQEVAEASEFVAKPFGLDQKKNSLFKQLYDSKRNQLLNNIIFKDSKAGFAGEFKRFKEAIGDTLSETETAQLFKNLVIRVLKGKIQAFSDSKAVSSNKSNLLTASRKQALKEMEQKFLASSNRNLLATASTALGATIVGAIVAGFGWNNLNETNAEQQEVITTQTDALDKTTNHLSRFTGSDSILNPDFRSPAVSKEMLIERVSGNARQKVFMKALLDQLPSLELEQNNDLARDIRKSGHDPKGIEDNEDFTIFFTVTDPDPKQTINTVYNSKLSIMNMKIPYNVLFDMYNVENDPNVDKDTQEITKELGAYYLLNPSNRAPSPPSY